MSRRIRLVYKCDHCGDEALATVCCGCGYVSRDLPDGWYQFAGTHLCECCSKGLKAAMKEWYEEEDRR